MSLFEELKRRNVLRVAVLYIVVGWLLMQVADVLFPAMELPNWTIRLVFALLLIGFPAALIFSWAFEITPEGLKRDRDVDHSKSVAHHTGRKLDYITIGVVVAAVAFAVVDRMTREPTVVEPVAQTDAPGMTETAPVRPRSSETSIAVLPFVNMSEDEANEYFSDGISEELLNLLVRVEGLRVPSRTSSFAFKGKDVGIPAIAEKLDVEHVLEGSVRKAGNTVRITAQLIDVSDDRHLWSETYDRELKDIFAVQDEIATAIVDALKGLLGSTQATAISHTPPTENVEAYQLYLRARHIWQQRGLDKLRTAATYFEQALKLDPEFARAMSGLAATHALIPVYGGGEREMHERMARELAEEALKIDPANGEALNTLAVLHEGRGRWNQAEEYFQRALAADPHDATTSQWYAEFLYFRVGRVREALKWSKRAYEQDPLSPIINLSLGWAHWFNDDRDEARRYMDQAVELGFSGDQPIMFEALFALRERDYGRALEIFERAQAMGSRGVELDIAATRGLMDPQHRESALAALEAAEPIRTSRGYPPSMYYVLMDMPDRALDYLEAVTEEDRANPLPGMWSPFSASVREDPRFVRLAEAVGWVDYWREYGWPPFCSETNGKVECE